MTLPTDAKQRKATPIHSGVIRYFPDALAAVAEVSRVGHEQHNPGKPMQWDRSKSGDELDALTRHLAEAGTRDTDGMRHSAKIAWRALANLQKEIEAEQAAELRTAFNGETPFRSVAPDTEPPARVPFQEGDSVSSSEITFFGTVEVDNGRMILVRTSHFARSAGYEARAWFYPHDLKLHPDAAASADPAESGAK